MINWLSDHQFQNIGEYEMSERNISCIYIACILISGIKLSSSKRGDCRSKDFAFDVLMMPYDRDVLMPYENALLKFNSRQKSKKTRYKHQEDL